MIIGNKFAVIRGYAKVLNMNEEIDKMLKQKSSAGGDSEIKKLLERNLEMTIETHKMVKKIKSHMFWQQVFGVLKILIIVVPLVIGIMYLPPLLDKIFSQYNELLQNPTEIDPKEIMDLLKNQ